MTEETSVFRYGKLPNFFILGAAKCGTTSLYNYLRQHPDIYMSPVKEPCFFCDIFQIVRNPVDYAGLFADAQTQPMIGEASHVYLTNPHSAKALHTFFPDARFILIFRHPADRAYSLYHHMRRYGYETIGSFEKALAAEEKRVCSKRFFRRCNQYFYNFLYFRSGLFAGQVQRYFNLFDRARFHFLTLGDLEQNTQKELSKIFNFLGVDKNFMPEIKIYNRGQTSRSPLMENLVNLKLKRPLWLRRRILGATEKYNIRPVAPVSPETREKLVRSYQTDLAKLYELTGIDLQ